METMDLKIKVVSDDVQRVKDTIARMSAHFEAAPDDDPAKRAMLNFGEIDPTVHCPVEADFVDDQVVLTCSLSPELQRIADMVPA